MLDPIVVTIEVPCSQVQAFEVFVHGMPNWWPLDKRSMSLMHGGQPAKALRIDPQVGGRIVETAHDDTEHHWGTIKAYDPHGYVSMDFHMGLPPEQSGLLEVRFTALADQRTRVELTQSNWEGFGDMAEMMRKGYGSSWSLLFEQCYKQACGG
jgi:hypothetical protein